MRRIGSARLNLNRFFMMMMERVQRITTMWVPGIKLLSYPYRVNELELETLFYTRTNLLEIYKYTYHKSRLLVQHLLRQNHAPTLPEQCNTAEISRSGQSQSEATGSSTNNFSQNL